MNKSQVLAILETIAESYSNFDLTKKKAEVWSEFLSDMPYEKVKTKLHDHIRTSKFPPSIAEISVEEAPRNEFLEKSRQWEQQVEAERANGTMKSPEERNPEFHAKYLKYKEDQKRQQEVIKQHE
ncbi:replicative helicase loader/inhibitor [Fictibacillus sp. JL2B1089]|uniref:replicative helicase loader/inhibitor n=1 Tax=Fictibacillus sp. JL2B1089 TaxID=3399565 RepID=UPI003A84414B